MGRRDALLLAAFALLATLLVAELAELAGRWRGARAELGRAAVERLSPALRERLGRLDGDLLLTWHVSARERMPVDRRDLEARVSGLLAAMEEAGGGRVAWQVIDPDARPDLARHLAAQHVAPVRVRTVTRDAWTERSVHATLTLAYGARPQVRLAGVGPEHLPGLQAWILAHLDQLERPARPRIAVAAPAAYARLRAELASEAEVLEVDFDGTAMLPAGIELLVWIAPQKPGDAHLRALRALRERGGSALIAGSAFEVLARPGGRFQFQPSGLGTELLRGLGLQPSPALLLDAQCEEVSLEGAPRPVPFAVRCIAPNQDFRTLEGQPNGTLLFEAPLAFGPDPARLEREGLRFVPLATTGPGSWLQAAPGEPAELASFVPGAGEAAPRRTLAGMLVPDDPWHGSLVFLGAPTPFTDGQLAREDLAGLRLVQVLARNLASPERLVSARAPRERVEVLHALPPAARLAWRALLVLALPGLAGVLLLRRPREPGARREPRALLPALGLAAAILAVGLAAAGLRGAPLRADLTAERLSTPAKETIALARRLREPVEVELCFSRNLPQELRGLPARAEALVRDLARSGAPLELRRLDPGALAPEELAERGVVPRTYVVEREDQRSAVQASAAIVLRQGARREVLAFPSARTAEALELRLAFALLRLDPGVSPGSGRGRIAVASDIPRLSAAEAHLEYQTRGLFAPLAADPYGLARELLAAHDFDVVQVDLRAPELPQDCDLLVWLQPRRPTDPVQAALRAQLERGGHALVAAQHFKVRARQLAESDLRTVHWPQPQLPDLERGLLGELSIELVREVLCDEPAAVLALETEVARASEGRDSRTQSSGLPFQLRAAPSGFERGSPLLAGLEEQLFLWGNRWRVDREALERRGLRATPLMRTSERAWAIDWSGGFLDPRDFTLPSEPERRLGPQPLALLVEGAFASDAPQARLLLLGSSELFQDRLLAGPFRGDHLLLAAAAGLALSDDFARIAGRRVAAGTFEPLPQEERLALRAALVGAWPLLLLLAAVVARSVRRPL